MAAELEDGGRGLGGECLDVAAALDGLQEVVDEAIKGFSVVADIRRLRRTEGAANEA